MNVEPNRVVTFHYDVSDESSSQVESSRAGEPMAVLYGHRNVVPGVEAALKGRAAGDRFQVTVPPEDGYGLRRDDWTQRISKKHFSDKKRLRVGLRTVLRTKAGTRPVTVAKIGSSVVDVDLNHPMAGMTLRFDIEILDVREATPEEIAHRHAHGPGGHGH